MFIGLILLLFCFIIPLHVYTIGVDQGIGIQGSLYRYQVTVYGSMVITIMQDMIYISRGIFSLRTALSIILWVLGSVSLIIATLKSLIRPESFNLEYTKKLGFLIIGSGILYIVSCMIQFGPLFHGNAGISLPFGGFSLMLLGIYITMYPSYF